MDGRGSWELFLRLRSPRGSNDSTDSSARSGYHAVRRQIYLRRVARERSDGVKRAMKCVAAALHMMVISGTVLTVAAQTSAPAWTPSMLETMHQLESAALRDNYGYEK